MTIPGFIGEINFPSSLTTSFPICSCHANDILLFQGSLVNDIYLQVACNNNIVTT